MRNLLIYLGLLIVALIIWRSIMVRIFAVAFVLGLGILEYLSYR